LGKPIAGKTGTTNDEKDVCSSASPDLVVGVFRGYMPRYRDCVPAARWRP
jgi:membrane carboxypeptidase/penicillin-binding protein